MVKSGDSGKDNLLEDHPGEVPLRHVAIKWSESTDSRLSQAELLGVAHGLMPPEAAKIVDVSLERLPELPAGRSP